MNARTVCAAILVGGWLVGCIAITDALTNTTAASTIPAGDPNAIITPNNTAGGGAADDANPPADANAVVADGEVVERFCTDLMTIDTGGATIVLARNGSAANFFRFDAGEPVDLNDAETSITNLTDGISVGVTVLGELTGEFQLDSHSAITLSARLRDGSLYAVDSADQSELAQWRDDQDFIRVVENGTAIRLINLRTCGVARATR